MNKSLQIKFKSIPNKKIIITLLVIIICLSLFFLIIYKKQQFASQSSMTKPTPIQNPANPVKSTSEVKDRNQVIKKIDEVNINQAELEDYKSVHYDASDDQALKALTEETIILLAGKREGLIDFPQDYSSIKQLKNEDRIKLLTELAKRYEEESMRLTGAFIMTFYYNQKLLDVSFTEADDLSKKIIEEIYDKIKTGIFSPKEAIINLSENNMLKTIDWNYKNNTGLTFENVIVWRWTADPLYIKTLEAMQNGNIRQISQIVRYPGPISEFPESSFKPDDNGYYFFLVTDKKSGKYTDSFDKWKKMQIQKYQS